MIKYSYLVASEFLNGKVAPDGFADEITGSSIATALDHIDVAGNDCDVWFPSSLDAGDQTTLDGLVAAHDGLDNASIKTDIRNRLTSDPLNGLAVAVTASGLVITTDIATLVVNDQTTITADPTDTKYAKVCYIWNEDTDVFSVQIYEKTTGSYAVLTPPEYLIRDIKEFSVVANGDTLVET